MAGRGTRNARRRKPVPPQVLFPVRYLFRFNLDLDQEDLLELNVAENHILELAMTE